LYLKNRPDRTGDPIPAPLEEKASRSIMMPSTAAQLPDKPQGLLRFSEFAARDFLLQAIRNLH
jgi:hypothetical protein